MKDGKLDYIDLIIIVVMIVCVVVAVQYFFNIQQGQCTKDPLVFAAKQYESDYGFPFIGSGSFIMSGQSPIVYFSSDGVVVDTMQSNIDNTMIPMNFTIEK